MKTIAYVLLGLVVIMAIANAVMLVSINNILDEPKQVGTPLTLYIPENKTEPEQKTGTCKPSETI